MPISTTDVTAPFDPTAYVTLTGAQLLQLVSGLYPYVDKGFVVASEDVATVPVVPDAASTTKFQNYVWLRKTATATIPYVWNENAASDATLLKWQTIAEASIGIGTITGDMIKENTIPSGKIISLDASKLFGTLPGTISAPPSGPAGGDLTGTYPDPSVANLAITTGKIALLNITNALIAVNTIDLEAKAISPNVAFSYLDGTGATPSWEVLKQVAQLSNPASAADVGKVVRVANPYTNGFELASGGSTLQRLAKSIAGHQTATTVIPDDNTLPQITEGDQIASLAITPNNAANLIHVRCSFWVGHSNINIGCAIALFKTGSSDALQTVRWNAEDNGDQGFLTIDWVGVAGVTSAITFSIRAGPTTAGTAYINRSSSGALYGASDISFLQIEEFQGTLS